MHEFTFTERTSSRSGKSRSRSTDGPVVLLSSAARSKMTTTGAGQLPAIWRGQGGARLKAYGLSGGSSWIHLLT